TLLLWGGSARRAALGRGRVGRSPGCFSTYVSTRLPASPTKEDAMGGGQGSLTGPDLKQGVAAADLPDGGKLLGHADGEAVLLVRNGSQIFAVGATCTHYGGPLAEGLVVDETVRCPWH